MALKGSRTWWDGFRHGIEQTREHCELGGAVSASRLEAYAKSSLDILGAEGQGR